MVISNGFCLSAVTSTKLSHSQTQKYHRDTLALVCKQVLSGLGTQLNIVHIYFTTRYSSNIFRPHDSVLIKSTKSDQSKWKNYIGLSRVWIIYMKSVGQMHLDWFRLSNNIRNKFKKNIWTASGVQNVIWPD